MRSARIGLWVVAAMAAASAAAYPFLPRTVPLLWRELLGHSATGSRLEATLILPAVAVAACLLARLFPKIDPLGAAYAEFIDTYWTLVNGVILLAAFAHAVTLGVALGQLPSDARVLVGATGIVIIVAGNLLTRVQRNWFVGIRTPWTMSNDAVWRRTNRFAARLIVLDGVAIVALGLGTRIRLAVLLAVTMALVAGASFVYSYVIWRQMGGPKQ